MFRLTAHFLRRATISISIAATLGACGDPGQSPSMIDPDADLNNQGGRGGAGEPPTDRGKTSPDEPGYCDVAPILKTKCSRCHGDELKHGAPFRLVGYRDLISVWGSSKKPIYDRVGAAIESDFMPATWLKNVEPPVEKLSEEERATLLRWVELDAPAGDQNACR